VHAVVHTHAPHATAFAITGVPIPVGGTAEAQQLLGALPTVPFQLPGTRALAESVLPYLQQTNGCLLANHGLVTYAKTLEAAHDLTEMAEAYCRTLLLARQLGPLQPLNEG
jgi:L-fuculose-phosphate aldolase